MQSAQRPILLVGRVDRATTEVAIKAAAEASLQLVTVPGAVDASRWLASHEAHAVLVAGSDPNAEQVCLAVRNHPRMSLVAVIAITAEPTDLAFAELYGWGGDDLVPLHGESLAKRLRILPTEAPQQSLPPRGTALIVDGDDRRRVLMARVLRHAGFEIRFGLDGAEAVDAATRDETVLVVADIDIEPQGAVAAARASREAGSKIPWMVAASPKRIPQLVRESQGVDRITAYDAFAPLENTIFMANEALRGSFAENRKSPRVLYGTAVAFRIGGRDRDEVGYVYNVSREGMFIRTLLPLSTGDEAWLEFQPPRTHRRVRLEAQIVWNRVFGPGRGATVPPGFGLKITGGSEGDLARYRQGYDAFALDLAAIAKPA